MNILHYKSLYLQKLGAWKSLFKFYNWKSSNIHIVLNENNPFDPEVTDKKRFVNVVDLSEPKETWKIWANNYYHDLSSNRVLRAFVEKDKELAFNSNMNMHFLGGHPDFLNPLSLENIKVNEQDKTMIFLEYEDVESNCLIYIYIYIIYI